MAVTETIARGAQLKISDGASSPTFSTILGITSGPDGLGITQSFVQAVRHDSNIRVQKLTFSDLQPLTFEILYDSTDTQHQALRDAADNASLEDFQLILTDTGAEQVAFSAYVDITYSASPEDFNKMSVTLTPDGGTGLTFT